MTRVFSRPRLSICLAICLLFAETLTRGQIGMPLAVDPRFFNAKCDGQFLGMADVVTETQSGTLTRTVSDCNMTNGSAVLTCSSSAPFQKTDVGKVIAVYGAGANNSG